MNEGAERSCFSKLWRKQGSTSDVQEKQNRIHLVEAS